jgi:hypothetical protein
MKMKCALELMVIAEAKAEEKAREQEIYERKRKEEENARTLKMCEDIGKYLEEMAENGERPYYCFNCSKNYSLLTKERQRYANGKTSYTTVPNSSFNIELMKEYFENYCFEVSAINYEYYNYGWGAQKGHTIYIRVSPKCAR